MSQHDKANPSTLAIDFPDGSTIEIRHLLLDFTGTLSRDGDLLAGVGETLCRIAQTYSELNITVMSADTFGKAEAALAGLPLTFMKIATGQDKLAHVQSLGANHCLAIGNGRNDVPMVSAARIGIAVVGPEGCAGDLVRAADVVVRDILDALGLLLEPLRLKATLRD